MTFPRYTDVDLALLLELVRIGRAVRPHETYDRVTRHFPKLSDSDKTSLRQDGRTRVWPNMIHWARDHLRVKNVLADSGSGLWETNSAGRALLEQWLNARGGKALSSFITSDRVLPDLLGRDWAHELRQRGPRRPKQAPGAKTAGPTAVEAKPPAEADLGALQVSHLDAVSRDLLARLRSMDEYEFENFVGRVLDALGFRDTVVVGRPGDGGVDVKCVLRNELVEASVAVQVKRQQGNVGPKEISYLRDRWARKADKLLFVTTSDYTAGAREVAEEEGLRPVTLVNGRELAGLMIRQRIGVASEPVERLIIDDDFFAG